MKASTNKQTSTTRTRKPKALPGAANGGVGKGGIVTQHGVTTTGYQRGCRCKLCVQVARDSARAARERKRAAAQAAEQAKAAKAERAKARRAAKAKAGA